MKEKLVYTDKEVMEILNIKSPTTFRKVLDKGLKYSIIGGKRYFLPEEIIKFIKRNEI